LFVPDMFIVEQALIIKVFDLPIIPNRQ